LQRQREFHREDAALAWLRVHLDHATQLRHDLAHHIQADTTPALLRYLLGGRDARLEEQIDRLALAELRRGVNPATLDRDRANVIVVNARAVVAHGDRDLIALIRGGEDNRTCARLPSFLARARILNAMTDGVAHEMEQRCLHFLDDLAVHLGVGALDVELDLLALGKRGPTRRAVESRD
jgi:hypothetical protein